ncbi:uncharacterized protein LOC121602060, partial [Anopheles merus]|uniref:uncharacterized protein LOC121602060 n=1 Tax=Anopheles merus TaxID=30066 RepID=UPI001BE4BEFD
MERWMEVPMDEDQRRSSLGRIDYRAMTAQQTGEVPSVYDLPAHVQPGSRGYVSQQGQLTPRPVQLGPSPSQPAPSQSAPLPSVQNGQMGQQPLDNAVLHQTLHLLQQQLQEQQQLISQMLQQQQFAPQAQQQPAQQYQPAVPSNPELILDALANSIAEFRYEAESGVTFEAWFTRYEDLFATNASRLGDEAKTYRATPNAQLNNSKTPAEIMLGRRPRTLLELLLPPRQASQPSAGLRVRELNPGESIYAKEYRLNDWKWVTATVVDRQGRYMYLVRTAEGKTFRRHINQLRRRISDGSFKDTTRAHSPLPLDLLFDAWHFNPSPVPASSGQLEADKPSSPPAPVSSCVVPS